MLNILKNLLTKKIQKIIKKRHIHKLNHDFATFINKLDYSNDLVLTEFAKNSIQIFEAKKVFLLKNAIHWFDKTIGLNDLALAAGYHLLQQGNYKTAQELANLMQRTGQRGPKLLKFLDTVSNTKVGKNAPSFIEKKKRSKYEASLFQIIEKCTMQRYPWFTPNNITDVENIIQSIIERGELGKDWCRPIFDAYAKIRSKKINLPTHLADPEYVQLMTISNFRNFVADKTVCLVANSSSILGKNLGSCIDSYDVVIRFNSFVIDPKHTGNKTNVHVCIHLYNFNLYIPVDVRIMISGKKELWFESIHTKVVPGAQKWLGDVSLSWPAIDLGLITKKSSYRVPTIGFNILRMLLYFNVCKKIDLFGFDFYKSEPLRLKEALHIKCSQAHNPLAERDWVMSRARSIHDIIIEMM